MSISKRSILSNLLLILVLIATFSTNVTADMNPTRSLPDGKEFRGNDGRGHEAQMSVIQQVKDGSNRVSFFVWNGYPYPITVTFSPKLTNMQADTKPPVIKVFPPSSTTLAYSIATIDRAKINRWYNDWQWRMGPNNSQHNDKYLYTIPFPPDRHFLVAQGYDGHITHKNEFRYSIDWGMPIGTPVLAARDGQVIVVEDSFSGAGLDEAHRGKDNSVFIIHDDGTMAEYSHINTRSAKVNVGDFVKAGDTIALSGNVGYSDFPHLHFRVYRITNGTEVESIPVLFKGPDGSTVLIGR